MTEWKKNSVHRLTVEGYSSEGMGVARLDGRVVFVQRAVAGETCDVQLMKGAEKLRLWPHCPNCDPVPRPTGAGLPLVWPVRRL